VSASIQEFFELGLHAFALSRFSGCWVVFKSGIGFVVNIKVYSPRAGSARKNHAFW
jgi:TPP-dependent indolepyruvate ferredoxin oxidoreductase alpha subunit